MRNLIAVLSQVRPDVLTDPTFLEKSVLVKGAHPSTIPSDLSDSFFPTLVVKAAVLYRDFETSERNGLVVFQSARDVSLAKNLPPCPGLYRSLVPVCISLLYPTL